MTPHLLAALARPEAYPTAAEATQVETLETHISWLFLTDKRVYKLKKPVNFGFVDYSSLSRREHFCHEELRLNRRLAADVYLAVQPVARDPDGRIRIGGQGEILDHAVEMRRLPASGMLNNRLDRAETQELTAAIADLLADFHRQAEHGPRVSAYGEPEHIWQLVEDNFTATRDAPSAPLPAQQHQWLWQSARHGHRALSEQFRQRVRRRRIREGHGDLHAGNICITDSGIVIYDCIEFSRTLRCGDVACDLAFLCMDLDRAGHWDMSTRLQQEYVAASGDADLPGLMPFYKAYRAMVRYKVSCLRLQQMGPPEAAAEAASGMAYARLALNYALGPVLVLCCGLPGAGKTTLARDLARHCGWLRLSSDDARPAGPGESGYAQGRYSDAARDAVYQQLHAQAAQQLSAGRGVVLDASYGRKHWRQAAARVAQDAGVTWLLVEVRAGETETHRRLAARQASGDDSSQADLGVYQAARLDFEAPQELPAARRLVLADVPSPEAALDSLHNALIQLSASR